MILYNPEYPPAGIKETQQITSPPAGNRPMLPTGIYLLQARKAPRNNKYSILSPYIYRQRYPLKYPIANTHNDMMQNPDYFERTRSRLHPKKYRFYFFDYLYYCGDRWSKRNSRVWGSGVIFNYWTFCIWGLLPFGQD